MLVLVAVSLFAFFAMGWVGAYLLGPRTPTPPGALQWVKVPTEPGPYFIWNGRSMEIKEIIVKQDGVSTMVGGKNDGSPLIDVDAYGARLWAGPITPPVLPASEAELVRKMKGIA